MIVVPAFLKESPIHGFGVYSRHPITTGTVVWQFHEQFDLRFTQADFDALPAAVREEIEVYLYQPERDGLLYFESTIGRYMNHSRDPNVDITEVNIGVAMRDIAANEEMTCDYRHFMADTSHIAYLCYL